MESALRLNRPFRLDRLGLLLGVVRTEFADYRLTEASIPTRVPAFNHVSCILTQILCSAGELLGNDICNS